MVLARLDCLSSGQFEVFWASNQAGAVGPGSSRSRVGVAVVGVAVVGVDAFCAAVVVSLW